MAGGFVYNAIDQTEVATAEISYRGLTLSIEDCLLDSFNASLCIMSKGNIYKDDFELYIRGIKNISNFIINTKWNGETSYIQAAKIMLLTASFIKNTKVITDVPEQEPLKGKYAKINYIRKYDSKYFNMAAYSIRLLNLKE